MTKESRYKNKLAILYGYKNGKRIPYFKNKKRPEMSIVMKRLWKEGKIKPLKGKQNPSWKGNKVSYDGLHHTIRNNLGHPLFCLICKKYFKSPRKLHWANKSKKYSRNYKDWIGLCVSCHKYFDYGKRKLKKILQQKENKIKRIKKVLLFL